MLYRADDLVVSKTGKLYRVIAPDPTRSTRQRTRYRVRRLSDGREMAKAYQPYEDFWRAPRAAEAASPYAAERRSCPDFVRPF